MKNDATIKKIQTKKTQPIYKCLALQLAIDIESGKFQVGEILPTEDTLSKIHKVSRHTVRQALRELKEDGLIASRARVGTIVKRQPKESKFLHGINTIADLLQFVQATEMHVISIKKVRTDALLATELNCPIGQRWLAATIIRKMPDHLKPLGYIQLYVVPEYGDVLKGATILFKPIYAMIEAKYRVKIVEIAQDITSDNLNKDQALLLRAYEGQAALKIRRTYYDKAGSIVQISSGLYPSGRFVQSSKFRTQPN